MRAFLLAIVSVAGVLAHNHSDGTAHGSHGTCTNTCAFASDGDCDDGGYGSEFSSCSLGTDCADCSPDGSPRTGPGQMHYAPPAPPGTTNIDYGSVLQGLWNQTDTNGDNMLDITEFANALERLGITVCMTTNPACTLTQHDSTAALFAALDMNMNGQLTINEFGDAVQTMPYYQDPLIAAFTNGANQVPTVDDMDSFMPCPRTEPQCPANTAVATVRAEIIVSGPPSSIYPGTRRQIKAYFAQQCNVPVRSVRLTFTLDANSYSPGSMGRRLQNGGNTRIDAVIFMPSEEEATAAEAALPSSAAQLASVPAFNGLSIEFIGPPMAAARTPTIERGEVAITAVVLFLVAVSLCIFASVWSGGNRATGPLPESEQGCCKTGCCSFNAVGPWATGELLHGITILVCVLRCPNPSCCLRTHISLSTPPQHTSLGPW